MKKNKAAKYRLALSKVLLVAFIIILVISEHGSISSQGTSIFLNMIGFFLVLIGGFGRLWSSLYIEGNKNKKLICEGPYSMMRNPLYVFSFILLLGYCCAIQSIFIVGIFLFIFIIIYTPTIYNEEKILLSRHSNIYSDYFKGTPRFFPKIKNYKSSTVEGAVEINMKKIEIVMIEIAGFILFFWLIKLLDTFHHLKYIETYITLY